MNFCLRKYGSFGALALGLLAAACQRQPLLQEIQLTGDIFFPYSWLQATLEGYRTVSAAGTVRAFLASHPDFNPRLHAKTLQAADDLFRTETLIR